MKNLRTAAKLQKRIAAAKRIRQEEEAVAKLNEEETTISEPREEESDNVQSEDEEERQLRVRLFGVRETVSAIRMDSSNEPVPDELLFRVDDQGQTGGDDDDHGAEVSKWNDSDDEDLEVDLTSTNRLRKLRRYDMEQVVNGKEYESRLREQYEKLHGAAGWALQAKETKSKGEDDEDDNYFDTTTSVLMHPKRHGMHERVTIKRLVDANKSEKSNCVIQALHFHPQIDDLLLVGGMDKTLRIFRMNEDVRRNPRNPHRKIQSVFFADLPIYCAKFSSTSNVIISGRRKHYYYFNVETGNMKRIASIFGHSDDAKSLEYFECRTQDEKVAFALNDGYASIVESATGREVHLLKLPTSNAICRMKFRGDHEFYACSRDDEIYKWDLRQTKHPVWQRTDPGLVKIRSFDVCGETYSVGTESGVVHVFMEETGAPLRKPLLNLVTPTDTCEYSPDASLLCFASRSKRDQLRLFHLPSNSIVKNFPMQKMPVGHVSKVAFNAAGLLACGNDKGKVLLWKLNREGR